MSIVYGLVTFYGSRKEKKKKKTTSIHKTISKKDKQNRFLHYKTDVVV